MTNTRTALGLSLIVLTMITLVAFSVPLYDLFCRVTGYGGKTSTSEFLSSSILERDINLKFNADVNDSIIGHSPHQKILNLRLVKINLLTIKLQINLTLKQLELRHLMFYQKRLVRILLKHSVSVLKSRL